MYVTMKSEVGLGTQFQVQVSLMVKRNWTDWRKAYVLIFSEVALKSCLELKLTDRYWYEDRADGTDITEGIRADFSL